MTKPTSLDVIDLQDTGYARSGSGHCVNLLRFDTVEDSGQHRFGGIFDNKKNHESDTETHNWVDDGITQLCTDHPNEHG